MDTSTVSQESVMSDGEANRLISDDDDDVAKVAPTGSDTKNVAALGRARDAKEKNGSGSGYATALVLLCLGLAVLQQRTHELHVSTLEERIHILEAKATKPQAHESASAVQDPERQIVDMLASMERSEQERHLRMLNVLMQSDAYMQTKRDDLTRWLQGHGFTALQLKAAGFPFGRPTTSYATTTSSTTTTRPEVVSATPRDITQVFTP